MVKILLIEDEELLRRAYKTKLTIEGFDVYEAFDGIEGLKRAIEISPDLILLDLLMPNMDGIEFLKEFNVADKHPATKIIVFSNFAAAEKIEEAMKLGATRYLVKASISPNDMIKIIREVLEGK